MTTDTTMAEDPALESGETLPKLEVFGSPIERKLVLDGVLAAVFEGPSEEPSTPELAARVGPDVAEALFQIIDCHHRASSLKLKTKA